MTLLAIDTASAFASVALFDGRGVLAEETWHAERRHDDHLFAAIERQLALAGRPVADVDRVAVTAGPGSFTGVRVAIAAAQGIARASGAAAIGICTADVAAWPLRTGRSRVCVLLPAGRGEHYMATYRHRSGGWGRVGELGIVTIAALDRTVAIDTVFTGDIDEEDAATLRERLGERAAIAPPSLRVRRAGHLAEIAWARLEAGGSVPPERLEPLYARAPLIRQVASPARDKV